jgi:hypothetical protein
MTTLDPAVYRRAAQVIREGGLAKGGFAVRQSDGGMAHCTVGALREATGQSLSNVSPEVRYLGHLLGLPDCGCGCGFTSISVARWNDRPDTTTEDVIALLTEAAEKLEAESGVTV